MKKYNWMKLSFNKKKAGIVYVDKERYNTNN